MGSSASGRLRTARPVPRTERPPSSVTPPTWSDGVNRPAAVERAAPVFGGDFASFEPILGLLAAIQSAGRATSQAPYEAAYAEVFEQLDAFEALLAGQRWLLGGAAPTAADWWLFASLVRFDVAWHGFYKLTKYRIEHTAQLGPYTRDLYQHHPAVAGTVDVEAIRRRYAWEGEGTNPKRLLTRGGVPDWRVPHDRWRFDRAVADGGADEDARAARVRGEWVRPQSGHRDRVTADGSSGFKAEPGRYHLYVANNCPWCHRAVLARQLKGLHDVVSMDTLYYRRDPERGWQFRPDAEGCTPDTVHGNRFIVELYERLGSAERSVPVLYDRVTDTIVNNESSEIIEMFDQAFGAFTDASELYPEALRPAIDHLNTYTWTYINNGAYKAGFTSSQEAHDVWFENVFAALDWLDRHLQGRTFLVGERLTLADVRLFPTIYRFDPVYYARFRLNRRRIADYEHLSRWLETLTAIPGVAEASNLAHCVKGYFGRTGNGLVPPR